MNEEQQAMYAHTRRVDQTQGMHGDVLCTRPKSGRLLVTSQHDAGNIRVVLLEWHGVRDLGLFVFNATVCSH